MVYLLLPFGNGDFLQSRRAFCLRSPPFPVDRGGACFSMDPQRR
jgi:hypothetical protein